MACKLVAQQFCALDLTGQLACVTVGTRWLPFFPNALQSTSSVVRALYEEVKSLPLYSRLSTHSCSGERMHDRYC